MLTLLAGNPNWAPVCAEKVRPLLAALGNLPMYTKRALIMLMVAEIERYGKPAHDMFLGTNPEYLSDFTEFISTCDCNDVVPVIRSMIKVAQLVENTEPFAVYMEEQHHLLEFFADSQYICEGLTTLSRALTSLAERADHNP